MVEGVCQSNARGDMGGKKTEGESRKKMVSGELIS